MDTDGLAALDARGIRDDTGESALMIVFSYNLLACLLPTFSAERPEVMNPEPAVSP